MTGKDFTNIGLTFIGVFIRKYAINVMGTDSINLLEVAITNINNYANGISVALDGS